MYRVEDAREYHRDGDSYFRLIRSHFLLSFSIYYLSSGTFGYAVNILYII